MPTFKKNTKKYKKKKKTSKLSNVFQRIFETQNQT